MVDVVVHNVFFYRSQADRDSSPTQAWSKGWDESGRTVESACVLIHEVQQEDL